MDLYYRIFKSNRNKCLKNQEGFSLVETAIGLTIIGLIGVAILMSLAATARSNVANSNLTQAESLARTQIEYIQSQPYSSGSSYQVIDTPAGYSFATPMVSTVNTGLQKITVTVRYNSKTLISFADYKVDR